MGIRNSRSSSIKVYGNTQGLKASQIRKLIRLAQRRIPADCLITQEFARSLTTLTHEFRRQVGVLVDRRGSVTHVMIGNQDSIELPDWGRIRAGGGRLRGMRCIHTHLGFQELNRDDITDLVLLRLDAMLAIETDPEGLPGDVHVAALRPANEEGQPVEYFKPTAPSRLDFDFQRWIKTLEDELVRTSTPQEIEDRERAILVGITSGRRPEVFDSSLAELKELARSADVGIVDVLTQQRRRVDPRFVLGAGKLQDLVIRCFQSGVDLVIFDENLTPTQARNLAERLELRVIDRTQLILDIFAQRASTRDGKVQVELAQLRYLLPRLAQRDTSLSRLAGGIGGRGPGETKLEINRRRVRERITRLEKQVEALSRERAGRRTRRRRRGVPVLSIVGYTNAGKSTLLRALTQIPVSVENKMFATLDPASRRLRFPKEREVIITDTVGFIRDLPRELVAAFRATLEELTEADLFLHVVDASTEEWERRISSVRLILDEIGLASTPELLVFNKTDLLSKATGKNLAERMEGIPISASKKTGLEALLERAGCILWSEDAPGAERLDLSETAMERRS